MASPTLRIRLFGEFELRYGNDPLPPLESTRAESLLAYLLLHRQTPQSRQRLAFLLWPDSTESQARTNLRHVLHTLRHALPDPDQLLDVTPRTLQWRSDARFWLDIAAFEESAARAEGEGDSALAALRAAVDLYTGDLLDGSYDEWLLGERERLRQCYLGAVERLTVLLEARGDYAAAILFAERLLRQDPLREETYRVLMRLHAARGDRPRALRVFHVCAATLARELGVEPSASTVQTYEALLPVKGESAVTEWQAEPIGSSPLVGRVSERTRLTDLWRTTEAGRAQLVMLTGEPGVGKSRLVEEFRSWCAHRGVVTAEARCYAAEGAIAYAPVVAWLRAESFKARWTRLDRTRLAELAPLLPELFSKIPSLPRPEALPEFDQRQRLFDAVARAILASGGPLLLVVDDLQWCDRETSQLLHYLLRFDPKAPLLVAATARREEMDLSHPVNDLIASLHALDRFTEVQVGRLARAETAMLAERITGRPPSASDSDHLYDQTEGNPLFVVEALRAGWTSGTTPGDSISPKVQSAIESRLAQLTAPTRDLVGIAATIGREFTTDVLAAASETDEETLVRGLDELWRRRIVREQGADGYDFSHDKIREVAYLALSPARRRHHHLRIAYALERLHAPDRESVSGQLAAHFDRAGSADMAIAWYGQAANSAQRQHANIEAIRLLDRATDLLGSLPASAERSEQELSILTALPTLLSAVEGYASSRLTAVHQRALDLTRAVGVEPSSPLLRSLALASLAQRDFASARDVGKTLRERGERDDDDVLLVEGEYVLGIVAFWQGELDDARSHFEAAVRDYRAEHRGAHLLRYGLDPHVVCMSRLANTLWLLGRPAAATRSRDQALALADEIAHPFSKETAIVFAAMLALEMRDPERVREYATMLRGGDGKQRRSPTQVAAEVFDGYLDVVDGRKQVGIARIQRVLDETPAADHMPGMSACNVRVLLEACAVAGDAPTGLVAADRALESDSPVRLWEGETRRLRAEFLAALGGPANEVTTELERALGVGRRQGAKSLELRAATSLVRHRLAQGEGLATSGARTSLAKIIADLPENTETKNLIEAISALNDD